MSVMPWDRWAPDAEPVPETSPGPAPVPPPSPPTHVDVSSVNDAIKEAMAAVLPVLRGQLLDYAQETAAAIAEGKHVDHTHPTITAETGTGRELVVADAKSRSARTFVQGLIFDLFAGLVAVVATLAGADPFQKQTWIAFGVLLLKTFVSAAISYVMRLKVTPTMKTEGTKLAIMPVPRPILKEGTP